MPFRAEWIWTVASPNLPTRKGILASRPAQPATITTRQSVDRGLGMAHDDMPALELIGGPDLPEPIVIVDYDPAWPRRFGQFAEGIRSAVGTSRGSSTSAPPRCRHWRPSRSSTSWWLSM